MIQFETSSSPFYTDNKTYCEDLVTKFNEINVEFTGFCNSYGYTLESTLTKGQLNYHLKFHKHQSTQNGVIIPVNAVNYTGIEFKVTGLNKRLKFVVGKSNFARFFMSKKWKNQLPSPYFIRSRSLPDPTIIFQLFQTLSAHDVAKFGAKKGTFFCIFHQPLRNPVELLDELDVLLRNP